MVKIQNLPESTRKVILWSVIVIVGLGLFTLYIKNVQKKLRSFEIRELKEELPKFEIPKSEMPEMEEKELKELEKIIEEATMPE